MIFSGEFLDEEDSGMENEEDLEDDEMEMEEEEYNWTDDFEIVKQQGVVGSVTSDTHDIDVEEKEEEARVEEEPSEVNVEGVKLIASFFYNNKQYSLVKHLEPILFVARRFDSENINYLISGPEATKVSSRVVIPHKHKYFNTCVRVIVVASIIHLSRCIYSYHLIILFFPCPALKYR